MQRLTPIAGLLVAGLVAATAESQDIRRSYLPVQQDIQPGVAGGWAGTVDPSLMRHCQEIRIELPGDGLVTFYQQGVEVGTMVSPAQAGILVGPLYRIKISGLSDFPDRELYPTIELVSRLHPPPGKEMLFPVPITLTEEDIALAIEGRMVTKVIYVEKPSLAAPIEQDRPAPSVRLPRERDAFEMANQMGRPIAIVRLGGRAAPTVGADPRFWGHGAPVRILQPGEVWSEGAKVGTKSPSRQIQPVAHEAPLSRIERPRIGIRLSGTAQNR